MNNEENNFIYETKFWIIFLSDDQTNLGRCVIVLKRKCPSLAKLKKEEILDFWTNVVVKLESACQSAFKAVMFNWTCLMNNAYNKKPYNPQVHWHFRPRYDKKIKINKEIFVDKYFGKHYERGSERKVSQSIQNKIINKIKKYL